MRIKKYMKGIVLLFLVSAIFCTEASAVWIEGKLSGDPVPSNIRFILLGGGGASDAIIMTEGGSNSSGGWSDYDNVPTNHQIYTGPGALAWYTQTGNTELTASDTYSIVFGNISTGFYGSYSKSPLGTSSPVNAGTVAMSAGGRPAIPQIEAIPGGTGGTPKVMLRWQSYSSPPGFNVYRISGPTNNRVYTRIDKGWRVTGASGITTAYFIDYLIGTPNNLTYGQTYHYVVVAGSSTHSNAVSTVPAADTTPPSAPAITSVGDEGQHMKLIMRWNKSSSSDVLYYKVYRGESSGSETFLGSFSYPYSEGSYTQRFRGTDVTAYSYTDDTVYWGKTYYYKISAVDFSGNESSLSGELSATPVDLVAPGIGTSISPYSGQGTAYAGNVYTKYPKIHMNISGSDGARESGVYQYKAWCTGLTEPSYTTFPDGDKLNQTSLSISDVYSGLDLQSTQNVWKTLNAKVTDHALHETGTTNAALYDTSAPVLNSASVSPTSTNNPSVTLSWSFTESPSYSESGRHYYKYWFDDPAGESGAGWNGHTTGTSTTVTLPNADGWHTVYMRIRDLAYNESNAVVSNRVYLDRSGVTGILSIEGGAVSTLSNNVTLNVTRNKWNVSQVYFNEDPATAVYQGVGSPGWEDWAGGEGFLWNRSDWPLATPEAGQGFKLLFMKLKDNAGNISGVIPAAIYFGPLAGGGAGGVITNINISLDQALGNVTINWTGTPGTFEVFSDANPTGSFSSLEASDLHTTSWTDFNAPSAPQKYYQVRITGGGARSRVVGKYTYNFVRPSIGTSVNSFSLPFSINVPGNSPIYVKADDLISAISASKVEYLSYWNETTQSGEGRVVIDPANHGTWLGPNFDLSQGLGYQISMKEDRQFVIVGSK